MKPDHSRSILDFTIDPAAPTDAAKLAELGARLFGETFGPDNEPADMQAYLSAAFTPSRMQAELADTNRKVWLAHDKAAETAMGYAVVWSHPAPPDVHGLKPLEIARLYADQRYHGRGLGSALMETCLAHARGNHFDVIWLGVWEHNARAIAFYRRFGFREIGSQAFHLGGDVQRDLIMCRVP